MEKLAGGQVPIHLKKRLWQQILRGEFLDAIFDCPYELHELTENEEVSKLLKGLNENQKEIFYLMVIRGWSPQQLAKFRGQTDRNIRKVYATMIKSIRRKLELGENQ